MTKAVPADIAAAIEDFDMAAKTLGIECDRDGDFSGVAGRQHTKALEALNAVILHHLRNADEMKAALERIEQGA